MKDDELENLAADYINGNMQQQERVDFERTLEHDIRAKQKVNELSMAWNALSIPTGQAVVDEMDANFYSFLEKEKNKQSTGKVRIMHPAVYWLSSAAAVIIFIIAFFLGKYSMHPQEVVKYKTVQVVKPGPVQTKLIKVYVVQNAKKKKMDFVSQPSPIIAQLRSAYSSKRISAVLLMGERGISENYLKELDSLLKHDPDPNVQLAILQTLQPKANTPEVQRVLINALPFVQGTVQSSLVEILLEKKSKEAIPEMLTLLHDNNTDYHTQGQIKLGIEEFLN